MDKEKLLKKLKEITPDKKRIVAHDIPEKRAPIWLAPRYLWTAALF